MARTHIFEGHHRVGKRMDCVHALLPNGELISMHVDVYTNRSYITMRIDGKVTYIPGTHIRMIPSDRYQFFPDVTLNQKILNAVRNFKRKRAIPKKNGHYHNERKVA
jgi:hypothetical protein